MCKLTGEGGVRDLSFVMCMLMCMCLITNRGVIFCAEYGLMPIWCFVLCSVVWEWVPFDCPVFAYGRRVCAKNRVSFSVANVSVRRPNDGKKVSVVNLFIDVMTSGTGECKALQLQRAVRYTSK